MKIQAKKSLGQHFLNSKHVLEQIIDASNIQKGETVLEIGPGTGVLTDALLNAGANVIAIEKDGRAYELLRSGESRMENGERRGSLKLVLGDVLNQNITDLLKDDESTHSSFSILHSPPVSYALIANIPYYITGAILEKFLENEPRPNRMVLLVQKEVAERIVVNNGERKGKESILSISIKAFGEPKLIAKVSKGAFTPPPTVDSAILTIENISDKYFVENSVNIQKFFEIVKTGFAHKRKLLIRNLEEVIPRQKLEEIWSKLALDMKIRAEDISVKQWIDISTLVR